jgi:beta-galactosidase
LSLNGDWLLAPGSASAPPESWPSTVPVPALVDAAVPSYDWAAAEYHWYRCVFTLSEPERSYAFALLRIEQAMFGTKVWLNGELLGEDIACYTSKEYDATAAIRREGPNELLVRVGRRDQLPPESAVGRDQERTSFIPGIWGDVMLVFSGNPRVSLVQVIPYIGSSIAEVRVTLENRASEARRVRAVSTIVEHRSRKKASSPKELVKSVPAGGQTVLKFMHKIRAVKLWSPETPFLYDHLVSLHADGEPLDEARTRFGMREFRVRGSAFYLNGKRIFLRGGNIALHRFFSDRERGTLPWNADWIRKALIDIPKRSNFNFFRNHIGQMYNRWYDIADEGGMLLQNEWQFWPVSGTKEQIRKEFTRWLQDNWNHPSIIIWDPLNESSDETVQREIVPAMKKLDPTRPWESVDFLEEHPYIYSLGPVLIDRKFGFTRSLKEIERSRRPTMLNEFLWWWLDKEGKPTSLTQDVAQRWLGMHATPAELLEHQSFLARELVELFRRMEVDAIQPFAYLTCNEGPTSHWFLGNIAELRPKPVLDALREAFAPFGVSIELWDRHFYAGERRNVQVYLFNDPPERSTGVLRFGIRRLKGGWLLKKVMKKSVSASSTKKIRATISFPLKPGEYEVCAELVEKGRVIARSMKPAFVFKKEESRKDGGERVLLLGGTPELRSYFRETGIKVSPLTPAALSERAVIIVNGSSVRGKQYEKVRARLTESVRGGGTLILLEPELGIAGQNSPTPPDPPLPPLKQGGENSLTPPYPPLSPLEQGRERGTDGLDGFEFEILDGLKLSIKWREDADKGGYDSHVIMEDPGHPIWKDIKQEHLRFFNGGFGGEIVSQHDVVPMAEHTVLARCGLGLHVIAAAEMNVGKGRVILFRLQLRGRLGRARKAEALYARRRDPVARRLLSNLLQHGAGRGG